MSGETQISMFAPEPRARAGDPETSHDAASSISAERIRRTQAAIFDVLHELGPATDEQLADRYAQLRMPPQSPSGLRTRRDELVKMGLVRDSGARMLLRSGRQAIVWEAL